MTSTHLTIATPEVMRRVGAALAHALSQAGADPVVIGVEGELGAGKTTLVAGVLAAMGVKGPVRSPTYTLIEPYEVQGRFFHHLDLYRLTDPRDVEPLGVRDLLLPAAVLMIEWPSRAAGRLPPTDLDLTLEYAGEYDSGRRLHAAANSQSGCNLVTAILAALPELKALSP